MTRASLEKRLAELELKRDQRLKSLWDAYFDQEERVLGADFRRYCEARAAEHLEGTRDPDLLALRARVEADTELRAVWDRTYLYAASRFLAERQQGARDDDPLY
jgi:hypothetical protein